MRRLLASIHDVSPRSEAAVDRLAERLTQHLGAPRFAMLVVPDFWGRSRNRSGPSCAATRC